MAEECKHGQLARSCEICELENEVKRLRTVLRAIEWLSDHDGVRWCPSCSCLWPEHASGCQLKAALTAAGEDK